MEFGTYLYTNPQKDRIVIVALFVSGSIYLFGAYYIIGRAGGNHIELNHKTALLTIFLGKIIVNCQCVNGIILVGGFNPSKKYESQLGWLFPIDGNIKNVPNHQPVFFCCDSGFNTPLGDHFPRETMKVFHIELAMFTAEWWCNDTVNISKY